MGEPLVADADWWRHAVVYQVYVRSFADADGDGIGDLPGLRSRLPYLRDLGVDAIWCNPWYPSPLLDGGYDVADYRDIDPRLGTLADAEALIAEAHELGIRVLADLVPNHTSWDHAWFRAALAAGPGSPERERYIFRDGRGEDGAEPPNNWLSSFGGPAWTRVEDGQWYLHLFDTSQPDLNWQHPEVRADFEDVLRFWFDRGIDGFRVDVAHSLTKDPDLPDIPGADPDTPPAAIDGDLTGTHPHWDRDDVHEIIRGWRAVADEYGDRMLVAEAWVNPERLPLYLRPDEYHQAFNFSFLQHGWRGAVQQRTVPEAIERAHEVGSAPTWVWSNHDVIRHATRFALPAEVDAMFWMLDGDRALLDEERGLRRARAAALLALGLPGSVYLYQGEELGLPEVTELPLDALQDPVYERSARRVKGRDGCRVPIPWTPEGPSFGFGPGGDPWLPQPASFARLAVSVQEGDPGSTLELYRRALALRREQLVGDEEATFLDLGDDVVACRRGSGVTVVVNMGTQPVVLPDGEVLLASGDEPVDGVLAPDDAVWIAPA
jgi:alpha-glucosidase